MTSKDYIILALIIFTTALLANISAYYITRPDNVLNLYQTNYRSIDSISKLNTNISTQYETQKIHNYYNYILDSIHISNTSDSTELQRIADSLARLLLCDSCR